MNGIIAQMFSGGKGDACALGLYLAIIHLPQAKIVYIFLAKKSKIFYVGGSQIHRQQLLLAPFFIGIKMKIFLKPMAAFLVAVVTFFGSVLAGAFSPAYAQNTQTPWPPTDPITPATLAAEFGQYFVGSSPQDSCQLAQFLLQQGANYDQTLFWDSGAFFATHAEELGPLMGSTRTPSLLQVASLIFKRGLPEEAAEGFSTLAKEVAIVKLSTLLGGVPESLTCTREGDEMVTWAEDNRAMTRLAEPLFAFIAQKARTGNKQAISLQSRWQRMLWLYKTQLQADL